MKKVFDCISAVLFFSIIIMFAVSTLFLNRNDSENKDYGKNGIRKGTEMYISDNFPLSENWKAMYSSLIMSTGQSRIGNVYALNERLVEVLDKTDQTKIDAGIECINNFSGKYKDIPMYAMLVPTASGIYSADLPPFASAADQQKLIDDIYYKLDKRIVTLDAYNPLFSSRDDYVYFKTDSRWTAFGAYSVYCKVIKKMGFQPLDISNYDIEYADRSFMGNLYEKTFYKGVKPDTITIFKNKNGSYVTETAGYSGKQKFTSSSVYYTPALKTNDKYNIFLSGNAFEKYTIHTSNEKAPNLLIIKSDYANCFAPFLTPHYSEITLVDSQLLGNRSIEDVVNPENFDQILFLYDIDSLNKRDNLMNYEE